MGRLTGSGSGGGVVLRHRGSMAVWRGRYRVGLWGAGILAGSLLGGLAAVAVGRRAERAARRGLVDWSAAEAIAIARLRRAPGALPPGEIAASAAGYQEALAEVIPAVEELLGAPLTGVAERAAVVDRATWVRANLAGIRQLVGRLEEELLDELLPVGVGLPRAAVALANRWLATRQIALLLAFLGQRVLGQYDVAILAGADARDGRLLFVEENVRLAAASLGVPTAVFRRWVALHEVTHAFEFEAHPWLQPHLRRQLEAQLLAFARRARHLGRDAWEGIRRGLRRELDGESWLELFMGPDERRLFRQTQAVMSLLEGFSDYVMERVGPDLVPGAEMISRRLQERRLRRSPLERVILRLTGMDLKLDQYVRGERFVAEIARLGGEEALRRLWSGPAALPRPEELDDPGAWLARMASGGGGGR